MGGRGGKEGRSEGRRERRGRSATLKETIRRPGAVSRATVAGLRRPTRTRH